MLALKLTFIPLFIIFYAAGKTALKKFGSVTADRSVSVKINLALLLVFLFFVALAAFIRLAFDIELMLPQVIRIHATHFKWFGIQLLFTCLTGFAAGLYSAEPLNMKRNYITAALLSLVILYFEHFYTRPIYELCKEQVKDGFVIQSFQSSCGPSALADLFIIWRENI